MHMKNSTGGMNRFTGNVRAVSFVVAVTREVPGALLLLLFGLLGQNQLAVTCFSQHVVDAVMLDQQNTAAGKQAVAADFGGRCRKSFGSGFRALYRRCG